MAEALGVAIAQITDATDESRETAALKRLLSGIELGDVLVQADALHGSRPFFSSMRSRAPTSCSRQASRSGMPSKAVGERLFS